FASVPFGFDAREVNGWLHYGGGLALWREAYSPHGVVPFAAGNSGTQMGGWFNKEVNSLADIQGLKMRMPGLGGEVLKRAGGVPVLLPGSEIFTALQTGTIDATEWTGPYSDLAFGLHKAAKYYYSPGWHEPGTVLELIVNKEALDGLPDDLQAIVEVAARHANQDMLDEYTARNSEALERLVRDHKVEVRMFPDDVLAEFRRLSEEVLKVERERSPLAQKIHASFEQFRRRTRAYYRVAEDAYDKAR
ncbi:MAG: TRAP transporter substrate-binding protein, partial [Myxococcota bacterium]